jgi:GH25 family lysozyme M1 (1,4-beta-N-acetylmuramidase)
MLRKWAGAAVGAVFLAGGIGVQPVVAAAPVGGGGGGGETIEGRAPVFGGVVRHNVDQPHSPQMQAALTSGKPMARAAAGRIRGIDVASHQHPHGAGINWNLVARTYRFVGVKATEGRYYANPYRHRDQNRARAAGMYVFAYHFAIPNVSGGAAQAAYFLDRAGYRANGKTLNPVLDIEWNPYVSDDHTNACYGFSKKRMIRWIRGFVTEVKRRTGVRATIYTAANWWNQCTGGTAEFARNPLWVASMRDRPTLPTGWTRWSLWQYGQAGVRGIKARTDVNYVNGGIRTLNALARG